MASFCLTKKVADEFLAKIKNGEIDPEKMAAMTSEARHAFFADFMGEANATHVNALLESKLLLKNQKQGMVTWAKNISGISPTVRRDLLAKIERLGTVLTPKAEDVFLKDLASTRLGVEVTREEAQRIADLAAKATDAKTAMEVGGDRMTYGRAKVELANYVNDLTEKSNKTTLLQKISNPGKTISNTAGLAKSLKATLDVSALLRQGWKTLWTNPNIWRRNAIKTFKDLFTKFGSKAVMDEINAEIISRPTYDFMKKAKLAVGTIEEAFPSQLPEKIPVIGRVFKASENAYTGFLYRQRADIFDKYLQVAIGNEVDLTNEELQSIGKLVNSLTGRGNLGRLEPAADVINNVFFSPRMLKAHIDTLLQPITGAGGSNFVRKQAAINLVKIISGTAAVLGTAYAISPKSVEKNPTSADFGKIRVKDTRFDVTGGMSSLATLAMRLLTQESKSSTTGKVSPINSGKFGAQTGTDVIYSFLENKLSPVASVMKNILKQSTFEGGKPTVTGELSNAFTPLPIATFLELQKNPNSANIFAAMLADALGISTNTYSAPKKKTK